MADGPDPFEQRLVFPVAGGERYRLLEGCKRRESLPRGAVDEHRVDADERFHREFFVGRLYAAAGQAEWVTSDSRRRSRRAGA